ncbi:MAG: glycoside hydrolase family 2 TIM barrel-domain containing protein [Clostridium sp.]|nr:glycoside hydrolase family 2 TIM barrel-domain containing protein [Clostridium sp.]
MKMSIKGSWSYKTDYDDLGLKEKWYKNLEHEGNIFLPGSTVEAGIGEKLNQSIELSKESVRRLRAKYSYIGPMWYSKEVFIPEEYEEKEIVLFLERIMMSSMVWVNNNFAGEFVSLSVPHKFNITEFIKYGHKNTITIRVDNRDYYNIKDHSSSYTEETQTIWNGIVGAISLEIKNKVNIEKINVTPDIKNSEIEVEIITNNKSDKNNYNVKVAVEGFEEIQVKEELLNFEDRFKITYKFNSEVELWNEFNPVLYTINCSILDGDIVLDSKCIQFGMREIKRQGKYIYLNGERIFLRGTLDCCIYPMTGYPPTEVETWEKIFNTIKEYGLNHIRFHSWCPPESAFTAADKCGIYVQAEGPIWLDDYFCEIGSCVEHYDFFPKEAGRIIDEYSNHPSFIIFSNGNEIRGDFSLLNNIIKNVNKDKRLLYTLTTNWDREVYDGDDIFIAQSFDGIGVRGQYFLNEMVETTSLNFDKAVASRDLPTISHEVGQYSVYPDVRDIYKYTGNLRPINLEAIRQDLKDKNMINDIDKFVTASGRLAANLYKDDIEAALRTRDLSGVQLLGLHDFTGQDTATVGLLNVFWENKGIVDAETFRNFFGSVVPLINTKKRIYSSSEDVEFKILIFNYSNTEFKDKTVYYKISSGREVLYSEKIKAEAIKKNTLVGLKDIINISLNSIDKNTQLKLEVGISDTDYKNSWNLWVYVDKLNTHKKMINSKQEFIESINRKEDCIVYINSENMNNLKENKYFPCFWSPVHFETTDPNGLYIDNESELFNDFPTCNFGDYQWKSIVENSKIMDISDIDDVVDNVAQVVPNFFCNEKMSMIFTTNINNSKVIFTTVDFNDIENKPIEIKALYDSIVSNMSQVNINSSMDLKKAVELFK